jgi:predicted dehydrogenase
VEAIGEWGLLHTEKDGQVIKQYLPTPKGNYLDYYDDVYNALTKGAPNPVKPSDAVNVIKVIETAFESSKAGKVIPFKK